MYKLHIYTFIVLLCGISFIAKAQYAGGSGVGFKAQSYISSTCSAPLNTNIYFGGSAEGFAYKTLIASVCAPPLNASIYFGGSADGFAYKPLITSVCAPTLNASIYFGGSADGFAYKPLITSVCAPPINASIYFGGSAEGFAYKPLIVSICPPPLNTSIYKGGSAEGFAYKPLITSICPPPLNTSIYYGGSADGFAYKPLITSICPPPLNASIYFGGSADGFSSAKGNTVGVGTWKGITNAWSLSSNWCGGFIPLASTDVIISTGVPFQPRLSASSFCNNLSIGTGANLTLNGQNLNVTGTFSGSGKIIGSATSSITIAGTGNAGTFNMSNASASEKTLSNLTISLTAGNVTLGDTLYLSTDLTLSNGTLNTSGKLRLLSTAAKTARIGEVTGTGNVSGFVIAEKYAPAGLTGWANIGNPVNNDILLNWQDDFPTSGYTGSTGSAGAFVSVYNYDESVSGAKDVGYIAAANATNSVPIGKGYSVYLGTGYSNTAAITIDVSGPVQIGDFNLPVSYTASSPSALATEDGWNLIANPYCSTIDWDNANWVKTNIGSAIQYYNADAQQYAVYVAGNGGVGVNGATNFIAAEQGFWVKASAANPVLTAKEAVKTATNTTLAKSTSVLPLGYLKVKVNNTVGSDETLLRLDGNATTNFDDQFDAMKLYSFNAAAPNIATVMNGTTYCINAFDNTSSVTEIPLEFKVGTQGYSYMSFEGVSGFAQGMYLKDNLVQSVTPLNSDTTFSIFVPEISTELNRYSLVFNNVVTTISAFPLSKSINVYPTPAKDILNVDYSFKDMEVKVMIVDMLGNEILHEQLRNQHSSFNVQNLSSGVYFVKLMSANECVGIRKWMKE